MLPYWFSGITLKTVGIAAMDMVREVRRQLEDPEIKSGIKPADYKKCIRISSESSLYQMIKPGLLVNNYIMEIC